MTISVPSNEISEKIQKQHELNRARSYLNFLKQEREYMTKRLAWLNEEIEKQENKKEDE